MAVGATPLELATLRSYALAVRQAARHADRAHAEKTLIRAQHLMQLLRKDRPSHWRPLRMATAASALALEEPDKALRAVDRLLSELPHHA